MNGPGRTPLIAGNWKMNGSLAESEQLVAAIKAGVAQGIDADVLLCPPFVYLSQVAEWLAGSDIALGGQNLADQTRPGAFTGEIAGHMLKDVGCAYVIVGHSERRTLYGEDNATVARKFSAAQEQDLTPILCVGETLEQRERGETHAVVEGQIQAVLDGAGVGAFANAVVAYEPVWAIGTGLTATPGQAQAVHAMIRAKITALDDTIGTRLTVLYGGSVNASNASELLAMDDIDGGLVGGASLKAAEFIAICQAA